MNILIKLNFGDSPPRQEGQNKETKYDGYNNIFFAFDIFTDGIALLSNPVYRTLNYMF